MNEEVTPEKIQKSFLDGDISREETTDLLISLINGSEDAKIRTASINVLEEVDFKDENIFKILENHLISDEDANVRASAARVIILNFQDEGLEPLEWTTKHDKSPLVIKAILDTYEIKNIPNHEELKKNINKLLDTFALNLGVVSEEARFFLDLEAIFSNGTKQKEINPLDYNKFKTLNNCMDQSPWLVIKNMRVEVLNLNFFNWGYIKQNEELFNSFSRLKYLDVYLNNIRKYNIPNFDLVGVPKSIGLLTSLKKLKLSRNNLHSIPESIKNLHLLLELDLSHNQFQEIPHFLKPLTSLEHLNMKCNNILSVPESMNNFVNSIVDFRL
ncbi:MAG: HEAT repeat domain-containing protein [Candidatus Lokiarchaeota archaeon]|nr:HEAT repeat domain-containing protein [Candidatus Lokiarchaeota archaeon]